jgi:hypothetical protein
MRVLVLCDACKRHVKRTEAHCPFCSAAVVVPARSSAGSPRGLPGGRAALFLTGAALAAAGCADEHEPDGLDDDTDRVLDAAMQHMPKDAGAVVTDAGRDAGYDAGLIAQPYGIPIPLDASIRPPKDAGPSCPQVGNLPVPVYGIGIDAPPVDQCRDAGQDAGADAGADAGKDAGADAGKDSGFIAVPPYGIAIDRDR